MPEHIRIIETGVINTGDRQWQFAPPKQMPFWRDLMKETEVMRLLRQQGAVRLEIDANYDEDFHEAEEHFGWGLTYGEYWQIDPELKIEKPAPEWQTWILLLVNAPLMRLLSPTADRTLIAEWDVARWLRCHEDWRRGDYRFYLALTSATQPDLEPNYLRSPIFIQASQIFPLPSDRNTNILGHGWQLGDLTLQPLDYEPDSSQRDWDWVWQLHPSLGPIYLRIFVDKTAAELKVWFERLITAELPNNMFYPHLCGYQSGTIEELRICFRDLAIAELPTSDFYQFFADLQTQRQGRLHQFYHPDGDYSYVAGDSTGWLNFHDGLFCLSRNYHAPNLDRQLIDAVLLQAIMAGELGELSWDLFDGDYIYFEATGDGLASLKTYLDPKTELDRLRQEWARLLATHHIDASTASNIQEAATQIAQHFQVPITGADPIANLETWLYTTPLAQLPRSVMLKLPRQWGSTYSTDPEYSRIVSANRRILWRWSFDG